MKRAILIATGLAGLAALIAFAACFAHGKREPFAIAWTYDTSGYLETCGCTANLRGGLTRRATLLKQLRAKQPVLAIEGAHIVSDQGAFQLFKGETIVQALALMDYHALCLGVREAQQGPEGLAQLAARARFPVLCANLQVAGQPWPTAYAVVELAGARIGIVALSEPAYAGDLLPPGVGFGDPEQALQSALTALHGKTDMVIACLEGNELWLQTMADNYSNRVDLFLTGDRSAAAGGEEFIPSPPRMNNFDLGKRLALITADPTGAGYSFSGTNLPVEDELPQDAAVQELLDNTYRPQLKQRFFAQQKQALEQLYLPAEYCADCHQEQYDTYKQSGHARALVTLENENQLYNPDCMKCHVVYDAKMDQLNALNCVTCHSNITDQHVYDALAGTLKPPAQPVATYSYEFCSQCHDEQNSDPFAKHWPQYVKRIYHGGSLAQAQAAAQELGLDIDAPLPQHQAGH